MTLDETHDTATIEDKDKGYSISASWENVSLLANKSRSPNVVKKNDPDKEEVIQDEEIPPGDYSAEAVAKCLLKVGFYSLVVLVDRVVIKDVISCVDHYALIMCCISLALTCNNHYTIST